jgi:hypothetical protein
MQATERPGQAVAEPGRITGAFEFEHDLEIFSSDICFARCPGCTYGSCAQDHRGSAAPHACSCCGTEF